MQGFAYAYLKEAPYETDCFRILCSGGGSPWRGAPWARPCERSVWACGPTPAPAGGGPGGTARGGRTQAAGGKGRLIFLYSRARVYPCEGEGHSKVHIRHLFLYPPRLVIVEHLCDHQVTALGEDGYAVWANFTSRVQLNKFNGLCVC